MEILKVKYTQNELGYVVNDEIIVPIAYSNRHYQMVQEWIAKGGVVEPFETAEETQARLLREAKEFATSAIDGAIQAEITAYNEANGIALSSVHNAESYSRLPTYTHQPFCEAVWLWSVELWEFMRAWQDTLTGIPTEQEILYKIAEKPFVFVV